jgi:hypothetical protein
MKRLKRLAIWSACAGALVTAAPAFADQVKLDDLPPAAKQTVERETKGAMVYKIEKESDKAGKPVYEVEFLKDGVEWEVKVSPTGTVIERRKD